MTRAVHKRLTYEDKFSRHYCCHKRKWLADLKRENRRKLRRILKKETVNDARNDIN